MFDRLDLFRDDTPTPRPARADPQRDARPRDEPRRGHRREHDARRPARTVAERKRAATADVGMYRAVAYQDLSEQHFHGHPYATRRAVDQMIRRGLVREHQAEGPRGGRYTVLTATPDGARAAQRAAQDHGHDAEQQTWSGIVKTAELSHDTAVYRAATHEQGAHRGRRRAGSPASALTLNSSNTSRGPRRRRAPRADGARPTTRGAPPPRSWGSPCRMTAVLYPDAQLEIEDREGRSGRVNVEIASEHYHQAAIAAKAGAGFTMHGSSSRAARNIARAIGRSGGSGGAAQPGRDGSVEL